MRNAEQRSWMTVVIATYNSARFLPGLANMLERQMKPPESGSLEVLIVDGGSSDETRTLAIEMGFRVIDNPEGNAIAAKNIGIRNASARLVCILDHDESLVRNDSLLRRFEAFESDPNLRAIISAGYEFLPGESAANMYASEFGDPVSLATYRCPNNARFRLSLLRNRLVEVSRKGEMHLFSAGSEQRPILCEMAAGSGTIDVDFFRDNHPQVLDDKNALPHAYYYLGNGDRIGVLERDSILHSSAENWSVVRSKISWRVRNAVLNTGVSQSGFSGRSHSDLYSPRSHALRFSLYALTILPPLCDALSLAFSRRRVGYLNHFLLTYYVVWSAAWFRLSRLLGRAVNEARYGE